MEYLVGSQRLTSVGNLLPTGTAIRITSVHAHAALSASSLTFYNGLTSASPASVYLVFSTDSQGNIHESGMNAYFPDGVWINTGAAGAITTLVGFGAVQA
jgi:hypothetical protein